jgi:predicted NBD/HSP70 family sugar kinase
MTNAAARPRNLALTLERLLKAGQLTRSELISETGLSKASVARLVTELEQAGLVETRGTDASAGPGRRSNGLGVPSSLGHVIGLSFGLRSSHAIALDLSGRTLGTRLEPTPTFASGGAAIEWAAGLLREFAASLEGGGDTLGVCVALPGRVRSGDSISTLPAPLDGLPEHGFAATLEAEMGVPVSLATDADMALTGVTALGHLEADTSAVLFTLSTALTVATRTRLGVVKPRSAALGDFAALPFAGAGVEAGAVGRDADAAERLGTMTLGSMLSVRGLLGVMASLGIEIGDTNELWLGESAELDRVRRLFTEALVAAIFVAAVTTDPHACVITGRLAPLAARVLPELRELLAERLDDAPRLIVPGTDDNGLTTALGAAQTARGRECGRLVARVRDGLLP